MNVIIANAADFEKVRERFYKYAVWPLESCDDYGMAGGGTVFMEAGISIWAQKNKSFDMGWHKKVSFNGNEIYIVGLDQLKYDNQYFGRPERVALIEERMKQNN